MEPVTSSPERDRSGKHFAATFSIC
jgi:hypothetical protein